MEQKHVLGENTLDDRRRALEEAFFAQRDRELIEKRRAEQAAEAELEALEAATGIKNEKLLQRLMDQGVNSDTLVALSLIPLVTVAWADEEIQDKEREALLEAAAEAGIAEGSAAAKLLHEWMNRKPEAELVETWRAYVASLIPTLDDGEVEELKKEILQRAHDIAFAAGGYLGVFAVNAREKKTLEDLGSAFDR